MKRFSLILSMVVLTVCAAFAQRTVSGTVMLDGEGEAIGANVVVDGSEAVGTTTEFDGSFSLDVPADAKALVISYTGFETQTVSIEGTSSVSVTLQPESEILEEAVVIGYQSVKAGAVSSGISVVSGEDLEAIPVSSVGQLLQGKSTGVQALAANGKPGGGTYIRIRGIGSINSSTAPLFIIDNVEVTSVVYNALNPNDIESMSILKDAAATSIYGSRASNGVVVITTKRGSKKATRPQIEFNTQFGFKQKTEDNFDMMDAEQKMAYETELFNNYGIGSAAAVANYENQDFRDSILQVAGDWQDILLRTGTFQNYNLSMGGGADRMNYFASAGYYSEEGIAKGSTFNRMTARINADYRAADWLNLGASVSAARTYSQELRDRNNVQNPFRAMYDYNPYETEFLLNSPDANDIRIDPNTGQPVYNLTHAGFSISEAIVNNPENEVDVHLLGNFYVEFLPIKGLSVKTQLTGNYWNFENEYFVVPGSVLDSYVGQPDAPGSGSFNFTRRWQYQWRNIATYNFQINNDHDITVLGGTEFTDYDSYAFNVRGRGFVNRDLYTLNNASEIYDGFTSRYEEARLSFFANAQYNFKYKYLATLTYRLDGTSAFGSNNRWGSFIAGSVAWNLAEEEFMQKSGKIDQLKLRVSVGTSGNDTGIGSYSRLGTLGTASYQQTPALAIDRGENADLRWEKNLSASVGIDFGFFNRVSGSLDLYNRRSFDLLNSIPLSIFNGLTSQSGNLGAIRNRGVELELRTDAVRTSDFRWEFFGNFTFNDNEVVELPDDDGDPTTDPVLFNAVSVIQEGLAANTFYLVRHAGVDPATGDELYYDAEGNITNVYSGDYAVALEGKTPQPKFFGQFGTGVEFKGITAQATFYYNVGNYILNFMEANMLSDGENIADNQRADAINFWRNPGDVTDLPRPTGVVNTSDRFLQKGDYLRLRDIRVGYNIPIKSEWLTGVNVFVQGTNLATWTAFKGDPEVGIGSSESDLTLGGELSLYSYPQTRAFTFGLNVNF